MMKSNIITTFFLTLFLSSCNFDEKVEHIIESTTQQNKVVVQNFSVPTIETIGSQNPINFELDTSIIKETIESNSARTGEYDLAFIDQLKISIPEGNNNFNFLGSATLEISSPGDLKGIVLAYIDDIPSNSNELLLDLKNKNVNLIDLIRLEDFEVEVNYYAKEVSAQPLEVELSTDFIINSDFEL